MSSFYFLQKIITRHDNVAICINSGNNGFFKTYSLEEANAWNRKPTNISNAMQGTYRHSIFIRQAYSIYIHIFQKKKKKPPETNREEPKKPIYTEHLIS